MSTATVVQIVVAAFGVGMIAGSADAWGTTKYELRGAGIGILLIVGDILVAVGRAL